METSPLLTVIVPVHNRAAIVTRTLDSIAAQTLRPLRLIVVDNNSTDSTLRTVTEWSDAHRSEDFDITVLTESAPGAAAARNRGLAEATSGYVMFFDSDDEMRPDHLSRVAEELQRVPETDILYFDIAIIDSDGWMRCKSSRDENHIRAHIFHSILATHRYAVRRSLINEAGGWNPDCMKWNDLEMGLRLIIRAANIRKLHGEPRVIIHPTEESITGCDLLSRHGLGEKALDAMEQQLRNAGHELALNWIDCRRVILAADYRREGGRQQAYELLDSTLNRNQTRNQLKLRAIYAVQRLFGHGGSALSAMLFKEKKPRKKKHAL